LARLPLSTICTKYLSCRRSMFASYKFFRMPPYKK
jgi:hypothetical protein